MKISQGLLALLLATVVVAQTPPTARPTVPGARTGQPKDAGRAGADARPPDPNLFDGTKFEPEKRPETGMIGEFEMPGGPEQSDKVGGDQGQAGGGNQPPPPGAPSAGGAAGAAGAAGGGAAAAGGEQAGGEAGGGGAAGAENAAGGAAGAAGGAKSQGKGQGSAGQAGAGGDPNAKAEGMAADHLEGGGAGGAAAAQNSPGSGKSKTAAGRIGSAELRIDAIPETDKDVIGREAAPGGTQGSNRAMPAGGQGGQGSNNQNKGVEKGKVIPKGL